MSFNPADRLFIMTLLERFNLIHVNFMIIKKKKEKEDIDQVDAFNDSAVLIIIRVAK